jgi:uncharacterized protein
MDRGTKVFRLDAGRLEKAEITHQGYLRVPAFVTRTGVFAYANGDGTIRRELRHPDDVFQSDSLATLGGIPVTDDHPNSKNPEVLLLDARTTKDFIVGYTADRADRQDLYVKTTVTITDHETIERVQAGKNELSCGYLCDREEVAGTYNGQSYDCRQRNIFYNHLAIVDRGRAGPQVRLRLDAHDAVQVDIPDINKREGTMKKITIAGKEFEVADDLYEAVTQEMKTQGTAAETLKTENEKLKDNADRAEARADSLKAELAKKENELKTRSDSIAPEKIRELVKDRKKLEDVAAATLKKDELVKLDTMNDRDVKIAIIKAERAGVTLDGKSDSYIEAAYDHICEIIASSNNSNNKDLGQRIAERRNDSANVLDSREARRKSMERDRNAWKSSNA